MKDTNLMEKARSMTLRAGESFAPRRVVVTGCGALTPAGFGFDTLWDKLVAGQCVLSKLPDEEIERFGVTVAGRIPDYDPLEVGFTKKELRRIAPFTQYALIAAKEALAQSGIELEAEDLDRFSVVFGSGIGAIKATEHESLVLAKKGPKLVSPLFIPMMIPNMAAGNIAIRYGLRGACTNTATACATGTHCIGEAYRLVRFGYTDVAICGGSEQSTVPLALSGFVNLGALSTAHEVTEASKPFDVNRSGFVAADGAGALVIEALEHAEKRGAKVLAEIVGFGSTADAFHITAPAPSGEGIARAMAQALAEGGFTPDDIGHVNAHGTATRANDETEAAALHLLAGEAASKIAVTSLKGCTGHMLGGAGAVEAAICVRSVACNTVPPTVGCTDPDPKLDINVVTELIEKKPQKVVLNNSLGFGGHNAVLAIAPFEE